MHNRDYWQSLLNQQRFSTHALIGGKPYFAKAEKTWAVVNPATNAVLAEVTACQAEDIDAAVESARQAFTSGIWSGCPLAQRKAVLRRLADLMLEHREELALQHGETGARCV